jgi:hypothetical protein
MAADATAIEVRHNEVTQVESGGEFSTMLTRKCQSSFSECTEHHLIIFVHKVLLEIQDYIKRLVHKQRPRQWTRA